MAETQKTRGARRPPAAEKAAVRQGTFTFGRRNLLVLVAGMIVILVGYILLGKGSITAAPILLVVGYCAIIPLAIVMWTGKRDDKTQSGSGE
jgi:hypothetical protein